MDLENQVKPLFQPIDSNTLNSFLGSSPTAVGVFSLQPQEQPSINLHLFKSSLILLDSSKNFHLLQLTFEIKIEVIYFISRDVKSEVIGFRLFSEDNRTIQFYGSEAPQFVGFLGKILNIRGFQDMFKPIRKLGKGNFATVYESERITDHQRFAVKAFSKQNSYSSKNGRQSLINQLSLLRSLNIQPHPNVLRLQAVYQSDNSIYVVLELLEGNTLLEYMRERKGILSDWQVKKFMSGILRGVSHLCKNRVMHRDLKPENVMIRRQSLQPVIVDFGLSTNVDLPQYLFFRCGTPGYVAPEIIKLTFSIHLQPTCDIFSLGCIFNLLLVNKPLFPGIKYEQVYRANKELNFNFSSETYSQVSKSAMNLLKNMLVIDASERITAENALQHDYFNEVEQQMKQESPIQTVASSCSPTLKVVQLDCGNDRVDKVEKIVEKDKKKKRKFFFF